MECSSQTRVKLTLFQIVVVAQEFHLYDTDSEREDEVFKWQFESKSCQAYHRGMLKSMLQNASGQRELEAL